MERLLVASQAKLHVLILIFRYAEIILNGILINTLLLIYHQLVIDAHDVIEVVIVVVVFLMGATAMMLVQVGIIGASGRLGLVISFLNR